MAPKRILLVMLIGVLAFSTAFATDKEPPTQYLIQLTLFGRDPDVSDDQPRKVLSQPKLVVTENHEALMHIGGQALLGDEYVFDGTQVKLVVRSTDKDRVRVKGTIESSSMCQKTEDSIVVESVRGYFNREVKLNELNRVSQIHSKDGKRWLELEIQKVDANTMPILAPTQQESKSMTRPAAGSGKRS